MTYYSQEMNLFYVSTPFGEGLVRLSADETHHACKVLRMKPGAPLRLINGLGQLGHGILLDDLPQGASVRVQQIENQAKPAYHIHLALAPTKNPERVEWLVEKAVEIGVQQITFFESTHSDRARLNLDRLQKRL